ncbi:YeeE/YedE thiosulfate transporter family protein [soil metagenome]
MSDPGKAVTKESTAATPPIAPMTKLLFAVVFGVAFGFLLQKGGVGKYNVLVGQLLLQDWTVAKVMMTAIVVGMIGIFVLHRFARVNLHIKPTRLGANIIGGLVFGAGFALIGYCPGTAAAALGQGSWDAMFGMVGLVAGSYLYAHFSGTLKETIEKWGDRGKLMLPEVLHLPRVAVVAIIAAAFTAGLVILDRVFPR